MLIFVIVASGGGGVIFPKNIELLLCHAGCNMSFSSPLIFWVKSFLGPDLNWAKNILPLSMRMKVSIEPPNGFNASIVVNFRQIFNIFALGI